MRINVVLDNVHDGLSVGGATGPARPNVIVDRHNLVANAVSYVRTRRCPRICTQHNPTIKRHRHDRCLQRKRVCVCWWGGEGELEKGRDDAPPVKCVPLRTARPGAVRTDRMRTETCWKLEAGLEQWTLKHNDEKKETTEPQGEPCFWFLVTTAQRKGRNQGH